MKERSYRLGRATPDQAPALAALAQAGFPGYPFESAYDVESLRDEVEKDPAYRVTVFDDRELVATAALGINHSPMAEIKRVVVAPSYRREGLATLMTRELVAEARRRGKIPYADIRADQIGMQKAASAANLIPICLEPGKHVVYRHNGLGAARETMIHTSGLRLDEEELYHYLQTWPPNSVRTLIAKLKEAHCPQAKNPRLAGEKLVSASCVRYQVESALTQLALIKRLNEDIAVVSVGKMDLLIVLPDASGFLTSPPDQDLEQILSLAESVGLQVVTYYQSITCPQSEWIQLCNSKMEPAMIRPWQETEGCEPSWQIAWQARMNSYQECLHHLDLEGGTKNRLLSFIQKLEGQLGELN